MIAFRRAGGWCLVVLGPLLVLLALLHDSHHGTLASDFHLVLTASSQIVHGRPIYGPHAPVYYVYPPLYAEAVTPFLLVPVKVALWIASLGCVVIFVAGLRAVGVRDPRAIAVAIGSAPVVHGAEVANASFLVFGFLALAWNRPWPGTALAVAVKFVAWPFVLWQTATKGVRSAAGSVAIAALLILGSWAVIGFAGLESYPHFLTRVSATQGKGGYSVAAAFTGGRVVAAAVTLAALGRGWQRIRAGDPIGGYSYAVGAMLTGTTYVYDDWFTAVFLVLALRRPVLSGAWFVPLALWVNKSGFHPSLAHKAFAWAVVGGLIVWLGEGAPGYRRRPVRAGRQSRVV